METEIEACIEACGSNSSSERLSHEAVVTTAEKHNNREKLQLLRKRKQITSSFLAPRNPYQLTNTYAQRVAKSKFPEKLDEVTQRVLSGKDHRIKLLQNDLGVAHLKLCEIAAENRLLRSLNKRNNAALSRFQDVEAELPSLLSVHNSEVRSLRERFSKLSFEHREQARELRSKNLSLQTTKEQLASLTILSEQKGLKERKELTEKLEEAKETITELEQQHKTAVRQLMLEKKSFKHQLSREQKRYQDLKLELEEYKEKIETLEKKLKNKEKFITDHLTRKEFHQARRNNFASFKSLSINSEPKTAATSSRLTSNRVHTSSTVATSDLQDEEDDLESELSFSMQNVAPSVDSIMNHLNYSSSDTDEEVSQIYRGRPTSVPQLALNTTASTPWAVDSRTFSIRTSQTSILKANNSSIYSSLSKHSSKMNTPNITKSPLIQKEFQQVCDNKLTNTTQADESSPVISEVELASENNEVSNKSLTRTSSPVLLNENKVDEKEEEKEIAIQDNYSKEALLAALKAIDATQNVDTLSSEIKDSYSNHVGGSKKVELMQELFGNDESSTSLNDNLVPVEKSSG